MVDRLLTDPTTSFIAEPNDDCLSSHSNTAQALLNMESSRRDTPELHFIHFVCFVTKVQPKVSMKAQINSSPYNTRAEENINCELKRIKKFKQQEGDQRSQPKGNFFSPTSNRATMVK